MNATVSVSVDLRFFTEAEFERRGTNWFRSMDPYLLVLLDVFRFRHGAPVIISPAGGALGRELPYAEMSDHNITRHGRVLAADVMLPDVKTPSQLRAAMECAQAIGFTSIGVYPQWQPHMGLHLGTRRDRDPGDPALWGAVLQDGVQTYCSVEAALSRCEAA